MHPAWVEPGDTESPFHHYAAFFYVGYYNMESSITGNRIRDNPNGPNFITSGHGAIEDIRIGNAGAYHAEMLRSGALSISDYTNHVLTVLQMEPGGYE